MKTIQIDSDLHKKIKKISAENDVPIKKIIEKMFNFYNSCNDKEQKTYRIII